MKRRLSCNPERPRRVTSRQLGLFCLPLMAGLLASLPKARAGDAPPWMHALVNAPLLAYDEKTDAVLLYSEINITVVSADKIRTQVREAYKILRHNGRRHGSVEVDFGPQKKIKSLHAWCIPAQGKDYEVKEKEAIEVSPNTEGGELISDTKFKVLRVPASDPGNIVGYEFEVEEHPLFLQDIWSFQRADPVRESRYSLLLPAVWEYKASWLNDPECTPTQPGNNSCQVTVSDLKGITNTPYIPPSP